VISTIVGMMRDDDGGDEWKSYVRPLLQLETVAIVLMIRSDKQFSFQIRTERVCVRYRSVSLISHSFQSIHVIIHEFSFEKKNKNFLFMLLT